MTATIRRVARPRGELTDGELAGLRRYQIKMVTAQDDYRTFVVELLTEHGRSFAEVSKATGLSTNTLQRWKREQRE